MHGAIAALRELDPDTVAPLADGKFRSAFVLAGILYRQHLNKGGF